MGPRRLEYACRNSEWNREKDDEQNLTPGQPIFCVSTLGMLGIAFTGGGLKDSELTTHQRETAMFVSAILHSHR